MASSFVVAELNTHQFMFKGVGVDQQSARTALLNAWTAHRNDLLARFPQLADSIPDASQLEVHFKMYFFEFALDAGYRDRDRLV